MAQVEEQVRDGAATRVYGVLATSLNEALGEVRGALGVHAKLLPDGRLGDLDTLLAEFAKRRVRIAIYGEIKAGKSTLINALAGGELSPVAFDPLTSVPVRLTYGGKTVWRVADRSFDRVEALTQVMRHGANEAREVVVETPVDLLQLGGQVDLVDTPGVGSEDRFDEISARALRSLDAVVLVVRYPALFTRVTRKLINDLRTDIGKLFVVWNLDADCAELTAEERSLHAEKLRADVAGAHELYLVDARAGFRAARAEDEEGAAASGITEFVAALGRFASSDKREVAALREAAKRADQWLEDAHRVLTQRQAVLEVSLRSTRASLRAVREAAVAEAEKARAQFEAFRRDLEAAENRRAATASSHAAKLRSRLRGARRTWARAGVMGDLGAAIAAAARAYADAIDSTCGVHVQALRDAGKKFGTVVPTSPRQRAVPCVEPLAPADRLERAVEGRAQWLRRALWRRWYLPGLAALERLGIEDDLTSQGSWAESKTTAAQEAARAVLEARLAEIGRRTDAEAERIEEETNFVAEEAELEALNRHVPIVAARQTGIRAVNQEARALTDQ